MLSLMLLFAHAPDAATFQQSFAGFMKQHSSFTATYTVNGTDHCTLTVHRPSRLRFEIHRPDYDYGLIRSGSEGIEYSRTERIFAQVFLGPDLSDIESQISDLEPIDISNVLLAENLRALLSGSVVTTKTSARGEQSAHAVLPRDGGTIDIVLDKSGRPLRCTNLFKGQAGDIREDYVFTSLGSEVPTSFKVQAPMGYGNYFLPVQATPVEAGSSLPDGFWVSSSGARRELSRVWVQGKYVVAIVDPIQAPSRRAIAHLQELKTNLGGKAGLLVLTSAPISVSGIETWIDHGPAYDAVSAPGAPLYYLVIDGKVRRTWLGDDDATRAATYEDIIESAGSGTR